MPTKKYAGAVLGLSLTICGSIHASETLETTCSGSLVEVMEDHAFLQQLFEASMFRLREEMQMNYDGKIEVINLTIELDEENIVMIPIFFDEEDTSQ